MRKGIIAALLIMSMLMCGCGGGSGKPDGDSDVHTRRELSAFPVSFPCLK